MSSPSRELLVPEGTRLVHVGPYKTGSTALQSALHDARETLAEHGVRRAGELPQESLAVIHATGRVRDYHDGERARERWERLAREVREAPEPRVVLSSEVFSHASPDQVRSIVGDLGEGVHVVVVLRPLASILPSQWQQYVLRRRMPSYEAWLRARFADDARGRYPVGSFWVPHRHDRLIARWADVVGAKNVTAIVLDSADRRLLPDTFEQMLGIPAGTLVPRESRDNRSLTAAEAELFQAHHVAIAGLGIDRAVQYRLLQAGADRLLKERQPGPDEAKIYTPQWALDAAAAVGAEMAEAISASGVRVVGDLGTLARAGTAGEAPEVRLAPEVAAAWSAGIVAAVQEQQERAEAAVARARARGPRTPSLATVAGRDLLAEVGRRVRRRLGRR